MRDDFPFKVKELLARRVSYRCSNPNCRQPTSGPQKHPLKSVNVGVAAHITAASPDGPRYDRSITPEERKDVSNGIWLCQNCAKLIDDDLARYNVDKLHEWKETAEDTAKRELEGGSIDHQPENQNAIAILKEINTRSNRIADEPQLQGVSYGISPSDIAENLGISIGEVLYFIDRFNDQDFLEYTWDDVLCGVSKQGRAYLFKRSYLSSDKHVNNPDYFSALNETGLKKLILKKIEECESYISPIVKKISLYEGYSSKYQLIVEAQGEYIEFQFVESFWSKNVRDLFAEEDFAVDVYREQPANDDFWDSWDSLVIQAGAPFDTIVCGKDRWILFDRTAT